MLICVYTDRHHKRPTDGGPDILGIQSASLSNLILFWRSVFRILMEQAEPLYSQFYGARFVMLVQAHHVTVEHVNFLTATKDFWPDGCSERYAKRNAATNCFRRETI